MLATWESSLLCLKSPDKISSQQKQPHLNFRACFRNLPPKGQPSVAMEIIPVHLLYALLTSYCLAGCLMEHLALFHAWTFATNARDLVRMQVSSGTRAGVIYVVPKTILTILAVTLAMRGPHMPGIWWSVAFLAVSWISSFAIQVRMQLRIKASQGRDRAALERLVGTTWVRTVAMVGHCCAVVYGLSLSAV